MTNGSDEILHFAFMAFCDDRHPAAFADITYGFYSVFAKLRHVPYTLIPLREDFTIEPEDYVGLRKTIFLANPNAPTGIALPLEAVERIVRGNPNNVVVVDEAYMTICWLRRRFQSRGPWPVRVWAAELPARN